MVYIVRGWLCAELQGVHCVCLCSGRGWGASGGSSSGELQPRLQPVGLQRQSGGAVLAAAGPPPLPLRAEPAQAGGAAAQTHVPTQPPAAAAGQWLVHGRVGKGPNCLTSACVCSVFRCADAVTWNVSGSFILGSCDVRSGTSLFYVREELYGHE